MRRVNPDQPFSHRSYDTHETESRRSAANVRGESILVRPPGLDIRQKMPTTLSQWRYPSLRTSPKQLNSCADRRGDDALVVLVATTVVQALASMAVSIVAVLGPQIAPELGVSPLALGYYVSVLYGSAIVSGVLGGDLVLRYGPIRVSQVSLAGTALAMLLLASGVPWLAPVSAAVMGLSYGPTTPASSHMLALSTPPERMNLVFSIKQTGVPLGGMLAGPLGSSLANLLGWRGALVTIALAAIACVLSIQPLRRPHDEARAPGHHVGGAALTGVVATLRNSAPRRMLALASLCFTIVQLSYMTYLVTYLHEAFGYTLVAAGLWMSVGHLAGVVGRIVWGMIADRGLGAVRMVVVLGDRYGAGQRRARPAAAAARRRADGRRGAARRLFARLERHLPVGGRARRRRPAGAGRATSAILTCTYGGVVIGPPLFAVLAGATGSYGVGFVALGIAPALAAVLLFRRRTLFG